jgi:GntR family transcriptional regulator, transcriptional repressor for pyruvate dehydrogenase complex
MAARGQVQTDKRQAHNLTGRIAEALRNKIVEENLQPGDRIPTERELIEEYKVSRTVVREALSRLSAEGLVEPRRGAGVFVHRPDAGRDSLNLRPGRTKTISEILEILELRAAVEVEAAGLAAQRRTFGQEAKIKEAYDDMTASIDRGEIAEQQDYRFHLAIAEATGNPLFVEFLEFLGKRTIPRSQLARAGDDMAGRLRLVREIHKEHLEVVRAISDQDLNAAREAMRKHLVGSRERYRTLLHGNS